MSRNNDSSNHKALIQCRTMVKWLMSIGMNYNDIAKQCDLSDQSIHNIVSGRTGWAHFSTFAKIKTLYNTERSKAPMTVTFAGVPFQTQPVIDEAVAKPVSVFTERSDITTLDALVSMLHDESAKHMATAQDALARFDFDASQRAMCQAKVYRDAHAILVAAQAKTETA